MVWILHKIIATTRRLGSADIYSLFMAEILHHLGCKNPTNNERNYQPQLVSLPDFRTINSTDHFWEWFWILNFKLVDSQLQTGGFSTSNWWILNFKLVDSQLQEGAHIFMMKPLSKMEWGGSKSGREMSRWFWDMNLGQECIYFNPITRNSPDSQWKKPWLVSVYRGLYYPVIYVIWGL